jgi:hypothetical protein
MSYKLTKEQLSKSAYYCAAGIDLQPLLRFGDVIDDFVYVSVGITKDEFLNGINEFIESLIPQLERDNASLVITSMNEININDIEHTFNNRLVAERPNYFNDDDFKSYIRNFNQFYNKKDDFHLEIIFSLKVGSIEKSIRLFHLSGEALATYDVIYRKQGIAPKLFLSIQSGMIEIPDLFSNKMFELSTSKPKIWIRGVWDSSEFSSYNYPNVFNTKGYFNEQIGEFRDWKIRIENHIDSTTNDRKPLRIVKAYGTTDEWEIIENITLNKPGLTINKILGRYNGTMATSYDFFSNHFPFSRLFEIQEYFDFDLNEKVVSNEVKIALIPCGFEAYEIVVKPFFENYVLINGMNLIIDIYYANKADFTRDF